MSDGVSSLEPRLVVLGADAERVGRAARTLRESGARVAGFVGGDDDEELATDMAAEMLGGLDEVVRLR